MSAELIAVVVFGAALAGFVQGLSGFAFGLVGMSVWAFAVPPQLAGPMAVAGGLMGQLLALRQVPLRPHLPRAWPFIAGGLLGVPVGIALLRWIDPLVFRAAVGALLLLYCPAMLFVGQLPHFHRGGRVADAVVGAVGGVMGGLGGLTGPAPTLWCALRGWDRDVARGAFQAFSLVMQALTFAGYLATGVLDARAWTMFALMAPAALLPTLLGLRLYARVSTAAFRRLVLWLLTGSGMVLLGSALPALLGR